MRNAMNKDKKVRSAADFTENFKDQNAFHNNGTV
jgi:hypothetical protein